MGALKILHQHGLARSGVGIELSSLTTPTYFPAVSSTSSAGSPDDVVRLLIDAGYPRALISAFDCERRVGGGLAGATALLSALRNAGSTIILDSGLFECQVLGVSDWTFENYVEVSASVPHDVLLSFDAPPRARAEGGAGRSSESEREGRSSRGAITIIHGRDREDFIERARRALAAGPIMGIAIPDRECGADLLERTRTASAVRRVMNEVDDSRVLHILGCGSPVVMAAYTLAGADTFDSLDWIQGALDIRSLTLTDPLLLRFTGCKCRFCSELPGPDLHRAYLHNLLFYQDFSALLRGMIRDATLVDFLSAFIGDARTAELVDGTTRAVANS